MVNPANVVEIVVVVLGLWLLDSNNVEMELLLGSSDKVLGAVVVIELLDPSKEVGTVVV